MEEERYIQLLHLVDEVASCYPFSQRAIICALAVYFEPTGDKEDSFSGLLRCHDIEDFIWQWQVKNGFPLDSI